MSLHRVRLSLLFALIVFYSNSQIRFSSAKIFTSDVLWQSIDVGNLNDDSKIEIAVIGQANNGTGQVALYQLDTNAGRNSGDSLILLAKKQLSANTIIGFNTVKIGDINNDGKNDIVVSVGDSIGLLFNGDFNTIVKYQSGKEISGIGIGDLDDDGDNDIAVSHLGIDSIAIFYQKPSSTFERKAFFSNTSNFSNLHQYDQLVVADINNDGKSDIIKMPKITGSNLTEIWYQNFKGNAGITYSTPFNPKLQFPYGYLNGFGVGDLNGDNKNDIIATAGGDKNSVTFVLPSINIMLQSSANSIAQNATLVEAQDISTQIKISDLNCDLKNDIVIGNPFQFKPQFSYFQNYLPDSISVSKTVGGGNFKNLNQNALAVADINNDGKNDIIGCSENTIIFHYNISKIGRGAFVTSRNHPVFTTTSVISTTTSENLQETNQGVCRTKSSVSYKILTIKTDITKIIDSVFYKNACVSLPTDTVNYQTILIKTIISKDTINKQILETEYLFDSHVSTIVGRDFLCPGAENIVYQIVSSLASSSVNYVWSIPTGNSITEATNATAVIDWGIDTTSKIRIKTIATYDGVCIDTLFKDVKLGTKYALPSIIGSDAICLNLAQNTPYSLPSTTGVTHKWTATNADLNTDSGDEIEVTWKQLGENKLTVNEYITTPTNTCFNVTTLTVNVFPNPTAIPIITGKESICLQELFTNYGIENQVFGSKYIWTISGANIADGQESANIKIDNFTDSKVEIFVKETTRNGCLGNEGQKKTVREDIQQCVSVYNLVTPNGDGINETFTIQNLEVYPENNLKVYNRWGAEVHNESGYKGNWTPSDLPDGLYYYSLNVKDKHVFNGWLQVIR